MRDRPSFREYVEFVRYSPQSIGRALELMGMASVNHCEKMKAFFLSITNDDYYHLEANGHLRGRRLDELEDRDDGLKDETWLSYQLYWAYRADFNSRLDRHGGAGLTEVEKLFYFTGGICPLNQTFVLKGRNGIYGWVRGINQVSPIIVEDREFADIFHAFLIEKGLNFDSIDDYLAKARSQKWLD